MKKKNVVLWAIGSALVFSDCSSQKKASNTSNPSQLVLPAPSTSHRKNSKVIGWPADKKPVAPEGFEVIKFADKTNHLDNPRWIYVAPNGDILISQARTNKQTSPNNIILFRDADKDGRYEVNDVFMTGLNQPLGMLVQDNYFYVGNTN